MFMGKQVTYAAKERLELWGDCTYGVGGNLYGRYFDGNPMDGS
jgi:hypothetical protein